MSSLRERYGRRLSHAACILAIIVCGACSPTYDWRDVTNATEGYRVVLPAKPLLDERQVEIAGMRLTMRMQSARVRDTVFAVGVITLPSSEPLLHQKVLDALRIGLARNLRAVPETQAITIPLVSGGRISGLRLSANGWVQNKHETIQAWLVARDNRVYQLVTISDKAFPDEQIDVFFQSFRLN